MSLQITPKPSRQYPYEQRLSDALAALLRRIEVGDALLSACDQTAGRHRVRYADLLAAYASCDDPTTTE